jgi:glycosyltransferase involved in cell wall biosynthesis
MLSVHMTTHRRHRSGLLAKAVKSVLKQTYHDFEFIIVDDSSFDGTADYLKQIAAADQRVKIIRNESNVNSVAISLGRALSASSTSREFITWMFDDNILQEDAFEKLIAAAIARNLDVCFGTTVCHNADGSRLIVGDKSLDIIRSGVTNSSILVPNAGIILKKSVVDKVGWYDSNIILRRSCDWEFFCRVFRCDQFSIGKIEDQLAEEFGGLQPDSLRNTNRSSFQLMRKYRSARNSAGWKMDLYSSLHHPEDRIPPAEWTMEERKLIYSLFIEYYISVGNFQKAYRWSRRLIDVLDDKPFYLDMLDRLIREPGNSTADQALGAISVFGNLLYLNETGRMQAQLEQRLADQESAEAAKAEKQRLKEREIDQQAVINNYSEELGAYKSSVAHRATSYVSRQVRKNAFLHSFLRLVLLGISNVRLSLRRLQSQN